MKKQKKKLAYQDQQNQKKTKKKQCQKNEAMSEAAQTNDFSAVMVLREIKE
jgi:hypothetical protein